MRGREKAAAFFPYPAKDVCRVREDVCFAAGDFEICFVELSQDAGVDCSCFLLGWATDKNIICNFVAVSFLEFLFEDFCQELL